MSDEKILVTSTYGEDDFLKRGAHYVGIDNYVKLQARIALLEAVLAAARNLEREMTNPVPCHVMRRQYLGALSDSIRLADAKQEVGDE